MSGSSDGAANDASSHPSAPDHPSGDPGGITHIERIPADVIVVAAGSSTRMGGDDKLLAPIGGRPLLAWTLTALARVPGVESIVVVTRPDRIRAMKAAPWLPPAVVAVVEGGPRRQESVAAGFAALTALRAASGTEGGDDDRVLLVHDGARPVLPDGLVEAVIRATARHGAAIPAVPVAETLKRVEGERIVATVEPLRSGSRADTPGRPTGSAPRRLRALPAGRAGNLDR